METNVKDLVKLTQKLEFIVPKTQTFSDNTERNDPQNSENWYDSVKELEETAQYSYQLCGLVMEAQKKARRLQGKTQETDMIHSKNFPQGFPSEIQKNGIAFIENNLRYKDSSIIAWSMGLGKTLTVLYSIVSSHMKALASNSEKKMHVYVLVPTLVMVQQWGEEIGKFPNFDQNKANTTKGIHTCKGLVIEVKTHEKITKIDAKYKSLKRDDSLKCDTVLIIDEAHRNFQRVKNAKSDQLKQLKKNISGFLHNQYNFVTVLITGTPTTNKYSDLIYLIQQADVSESRSELYEETIFLLDQIEKLQAENIGRSDEATAEARKNFDIAVEFFVSFMRTAFSGMVQRHGQKNLNIMINEMAISRGDKNLIQKTPGDNYLFIIESMETLKKNNFSRLRLEYVHKSPNVISDKNVISSDEMKDYENIIKTFSYTELFLLGTRENIVHIPSKINLFTHYIEFNVSQSALLTYASEHVPSMHNLRVCNAKTQKQKPNTNGTNTVVASLGNQQHRVFNFCAKEERKVKKSYSNISYITVRPDEYKMFLLGKILHESQTHKKKIIVFAQFLTTLQMAQQKIWRLNWRNQQDTPHWLEITDDYIQTNKLEKFELGYCEKLKSLTEEQLTETGILESFDLMGIRKDNYIECQGKRFKPKCNFFERQETTDDAPLQVCYKVQTISDFQKCNVLTADQLNNMDTSDLEHGDLIRVDFTSDKKVDAEEKKGKEVEENFAIFKYSVVVPSPKYRYCTLFPSFTQKRKIVNARGGKKTSKDQTQSGKKTSKDQTQSGENTSKDQTQSGKKTTAKEKDPGQNNQAQQILDQYTLFKDKEQNVDVVFVSNQYGTEGLNLMEASKVLFLDVPFTAKDLQQAICRSWRLGQLLDCHVYIPVCSNLGETRRYEICKAKKENAAYLVDRQHKQNELDLDIGGEEQYDLHQDEMDGTEESLIISCDAEDAGGVVHDRWPDFAVHEKVTQYELQYDETNKYQHEEHEFNLTEQNIRQSMTKFRGIKYGERIFAPSVANEYKIRIFSGLILKSLASVCYHDKTLKIFICGDFIHTQAPKFWPTKRDAALDFQTSNKHSCYGLAAVENQEPKKLAECWHPFTETTQTLFEDKNQAGKFQSVKKISYIYTSNSPKISMWSPICENIEGKSVAMKHALFCLLQITEVVEIDLSKQTDTLLRFIHNITDLHNKEKVKKTSKSYDKLQMPYYAQTISKDIDIWSGINKEEDVLQAAIKILRHIDTTTKSELMKNFQCELNIGTEQLIFPGAGQDDENSHKVQRFIKHACMDTELGSYDVISLKDQQTFSQFFEEALKKSGLKSESDAKFQFGKYFLFNMLDALKQDEKCEQRSVSLYGVLNTLCLNTKILVMCLKRENELLTIVLDDRNVSKDIKEKYFWCMNSSGQISYAVKYFNKSDTPVWLFSDKGLEREHASKNNDRTVVLFIQQKS